MRCIYCNHVNPEDEPRCQRCARRLPAAPEACMGAVALAMAPAPSWTPSQSAAAAAPQRAQIPRQTRLFSEGDGGKVVAFPSAPKTHEPKPRQRRQAAQASDSQAFLDFLPPTPHAPRTLKTSVEAVIYCDAPVATPTHRAVGFALDFSMVVIAIG